MFYESNPHKVLRFGDVLEGFVLSATSMKSPHDVKERRQYGIDVRVPHHAVVLSPCCSIGDKTLALSPLIGVNPAFFDNPFLREDLTRVNGKLKPEQSVPPEIWKKLPPQEKDRRFGGNREGYAFLEYFVYEKHDLLDYYTVHRQDRNIETNYYMVDFRRIHRVECDRVANPKQAPLEAKVLELSVQTRTTLRAKLAWYFGRPAPEDMV